MTNAPDSGQLEATLTSLAGLIFEVLVASGTVKSDVLALALEQQRDAALQKGLGQTAGHFEFLRESVLRRAGERSSLESLLREPPEGTA